MIQSFKCKESEHLFNRQKYKKIPKNIERAALRKLYILNAAMDIKELLVPPGNRLEALSGKRKGQHSIRINQQWRICFTWKDNNAYDVEIIDYH